MSDRKGKLCELLLEDLRRALPPQPLSQTVTSVELQRKVARKSKRLERHCEPHAAPDHSSSINALRDEVQLLREQVLLEADLVAELEHESGFLRRAPVNSKKSVTQEKVD